MSRLGRWWLGPVSAGLAPVLLVVWVTVGGGLSSERRMAPFPRGGELDYSGAPFRGYPRLRADLVGSRVGAEVAREPRRRAPVDRRGDASGRAPAVLEHDPTNDAFADAIAIRSVPFTARTTTSDADREGAGEPANCSPVGGTVWYRFLPHATIGLIGNTFGSDHSTAIAVFEGRSISGLRSVACDADVSGNAQVAFVARAGGSYFFQVTGPSGGGDLTFTVESQGTTSLVSVSSLGEPANSASSRPAVTADGRYVTFLSGATNLVPDYRPCVGPYVYSKQDANRPKTCTQLYLRDRLAGTTEMLSVASNGEQADGDTFYSGISDDGRYAVFTSDASNLVEGDTIGTWDVFVRDRHSRTTEMIAVSSTGKPAACGYHDGCNERVAISSSGHMVAFTSWGYNLVEGDGNKVADVFVRDLVRRTTTRASVSSAGVEANADSYVDSISPDGRVVTFYSSASNLSDDSECDGQCDGGGPWLDLYAHDLVTHTTSRVSVSSAGERANSDSGYRQSEMRSVSTGGGRVVFGSWASNLVGDDRNQSLDVFVRDRHEGTTRRISLAHAGGEIPEDDLPARIIRDPVAYVEEDHLEGGGTDWSISEDGRYVAFSFLSDDLVAGDTNGRRDIFVRDLTSNTTVRASVSSQGEQSDNLSWACAISGNGRVVAFASHATNLVPGVPLTGLTQIYVHER